MQALLDDEVKVAGDKVFIVHDDKAIDAATGAPATLPDGAEDVINNNRMRGALEAALAALRLFSPDVAVRARGDRRARQGDARRRPAAADREGAAPPRPMPQLKDAARRMRAAILISSPDTAKRLAAAQALADEQPEHRRQPAAGAPRRPAARPTPRCAPRCSSRSTRCAAASPGASGSACVFTGVSLGSILLLVALGLAITYGLMGVINMAHGELMMIGAYATYVVQNLFRAYAAGRVRRLRRWWRSRPRSSSRRWSARCSSAA